MNTKICKKCNINKDLNEFSTAGSYNGNIYYRPDCKECVRSYMKSDAGKQAQIKYRNSARGKVIKQRHKKTQKYRDQQRAYENNRLKTNPLFKLQKRIRDRVRLACKAKSWKKNSKFDQYIGCTPTQLKQYLESKFELGMNWNNYTLFGWHVDHIIPLSSAKTSEEIWKLCHYTNLQPLWAKDNIKKSNK